MRTSRFVLPAALASVVALLAACGGGGPRGISTGTMPEGGTFHGVWHSLQYGEMHFCQSGSRVIGEYTKDERTGSVQGEVRGDVLFFEWSEDRELVTGRPTSTTGHGYFRLLHKEDGRWYLDGEWGLGDDYSGGGQWLAVKLERQQPDQCYAHVRRGPEGEEALPDDYEDESDEDEGGADDGADEGAADQL